MPEAAFGSVLLAALVKKFVDALRLATALARGEREALSPLLTQLVAWAGGIAGVFLFAATDFAAGISVGGAALDKASGPTLILAGLMVTSFASALLVDVPKSIDNTQTASVPPLLASGRGPRQAPPGRVA